MPPAGEIGKMLPPAVPAVEQVERQRSDRTSDYLSVLDIRHIFPLAELVRFPLVYHHNHGLARRDPFVLKLQGEEVGQLARPGRVAPEQHGVVEQEVARSAQMLLDVPLAL